jgi:hypothetical protein
MQKNEILIAQAKLFNNSLSEQQIEYIINNNIFIYSDNIDITILSDSLFSLEDIVWVYDKNNYRIPYLHDIKLNQIKIHTSGNIYDYISSSSLIINDNIICGEKFVGLCDVFIGSINSINANPNNRCIQKNVVNIESNIYDVVNKYDTIFVKTDDLLYFYHKISNNNIKLNNKIIISHNSDYEIDSKYIHFLNNIKKQYSQNCLIYHTNLQPIPIGIENTQWFDHEIFHKIRIRTDIKKEKEIYFNFSLETHFSRKECYDKLKNILVWNKKLSKEDYFIELKKHKYAICPRGNGLDTHRIWECLYLDVIPIMLKNDYINIPNLPIIYLNDWNDLDINYLTSNFQNIELSKITFYYYYKNINLN